MRRLMIYMCARHGLYIGVLSCLILLTHCTKTSAEKIEPPKKEEGTPGTQPNPLVAEHWKVGQRFFIDNEWAECMVGDMPLVLTAPHGGDIKPAGIPDRSCPNAKTAKDLYTQELAREIAAELYETYGVRPYVVINLLHRSKLDPNREIEEASCGNETMKEAWRGFQGYIDSALSTAVHHHGRALFVDLHGHVGDQIELGYSLTGTNLRTLANGNDITNLIAKSTMVNYMTKRSPAIFQGMIMGDAAFGTLLENEGIPAMPSKQKKAPLSGVSFFSGGYISDRYGAVAYPGVYGFQMECHPSIRNAERSAFVKTFAKLIMQYLENTTF